MPARWPLGPHATHNLALLLLVAGAAGLGLPLLLKNPNIGSDSLSYLLPVHDLVAGDWRAMARSGALVFPPGLGLLAYPFYLLTDDIPLSGMLVSFCSYLLAVPVVYLIGRQALDGRAGLLAAFLTASNPYLLKFSYQNYADAAFTLFFLLSFLGFLRIWLEGPTLGRHARLGLAWGMAYLLRPEATLIAFLGLACLALRPWLVRREPGGRPWARLGGPALAAALFLLLSGPYVLYLHHYTGQWSFSGKFWPTLTTYSQIYLGEPAYQEPAGLAGQGNLARALAYAQSRPGLFLRRLHLNAVNIARTLLQMAWPALAPLALLVLAHFIRGREAWPGPPRPDRRLGVFLAALPMYCSPLPVLLFFFVTDRYLLPYAALLHVLLAWPLSALAQGLAPRRPQVVLLGVCLLALLTLSGPGARMLSWGGRLLPPPPTLPELYATEHGNLGLRAVGLWLGERYGPERRYRVMGAKKLGVVLFFAGGRRAVGQDLALEVDQSRDLAWVARQLREGAADFLVLDSHYCPGRPPLSELWAQPGLAPGLGLKLLAEDPDGRYRVFTAAGGPPTDQPLAKPEKSHSN